MMGRARKSEARDHAAVGRWRAVVRAVIGATTIFAGIPMAATATPQPAAAPAQVERVRYAADGSSTRVIVLLSRPVPYEVRLLPGASRGSERRLVLDFSNARLAASAAEPIGVEDGLLKRIRTGQFTARTARVVLDLVSVTDHRVSEESNPTRIVIDITGHALPKSELAAPALPAVPAPRLPAVPTTSEPDTSLRASERGRESEPDPTRPAAEAGVTPPRDAETPSNAKSDAPKEQEKERRAAAAAKAAAERTASAEARAALERREAAELEAEAARKAAQELKAAMEARAAVERREAVELKAEADRKATELRAAMEARAAVERREAAQLRAEAERNAAAELKAAEARAEVERREAAALKAEIERKAAAEQKAEDEAKAQAGRVTSEQSRDNTPSGRPRRWRIVLDPGHGGNDPGAQGVDGAFEKNVVLAIAKRLKVRLEEGLKAEVLLTRSRDVTRSLAERTAFANASSADLFLSIHANADSAGVLRGVETYTLNNSHDRATMRLAKMENGPAIRTGRGDLSFILSDMVQTGKEEESIALAQQLHHGVLARLRSRYLDIHDLGVKKGPFYVLVGAYMPCVLVETSFLSHPVEGRRLSTASYQAEVAEGLYTGIAQFLADARLAKTL